jgi:hypothetical protein
MHRSSIEHVFEMASAKLPNRAKKIRLKIKKSFEEAEFCSLSELNMLFRVPLAFAMRRLTRKECPSELVILTQSFSSLGGVSS